MGLGHDFAQFVAEERRRGRPRLSKKAVNNWLFAFFWIYLLIALGGIAVISIIFGWWWLGLVVPYTFSLVYWWRFGNFHARKHSVTPWS